MLFGDTMCFSGLGSSEELLTNIRHASLYEFFVELFCRYWGGRCRRQTHSLLRTKIIIWRDFIAISYKNGLLFFVRLLGLFIGLISSGESILFMFY